MAVLRGGFSDRSVFVQDMDGIKIQVENKWCTFRPYLLILFLLHLFQVSLINGFIIMHYRAFSWYSFEGSNSVNAVYDKAADFELRLLYCLKARQLGFVGV
jgi:hypothetical protein